MICTPQQIFFGDQIEKNGMGEHVAGMRGGEKCMQGFGGET